MTENASDRSSVAADNKLRDAAADKRSIKNLDLGIYIAVQYSIV